MMQQGQVFELNPGRVDGRTLWAYRYRTGGRTAKRIQRGGFASEQGARDSLERALDRLRRQQGSGRMLTLAVGAFGERRLDELIPHEIAAWRMTIRPGYRFEATQALRQVLQRAVVGGLLDVNPAKLGVENPQRRPTEKRPFESWDDVEAVAARLPGPDGDLRRRHGSAAR